MFIGISLLVPAFRRMYYKLPWLFPLIKIFYVNVLITSIAHMIMNFGYEIQDETRHSIFFALTIAEIVLGRFLMCLWFSRNRVEYVGRQANV
jgi:drug/metabolite transporter (DMT)-like permease